MRQTNVSLSMPTKSFCFGFLFSAFNHQTRWSPSLQSSWGWTEMNKYLEYKNDYLIFNIIWYSIFSDIQYFPIFNIWEWSPDIGISSGTRPAGPPGLLPCGIMYEFVDRCIVSWSVSFMSSWPLLWPVASSISQTVLVRERESLPEE